MKLFLKKFLGSFSIGSIVDLVVKTNESLSPTHWPFTQNASSTVIESYGPSYDKCTDEACSGPAINMVMVNENGTEITEEEDPTLYYNEEYTYAEVLFAPKKYAYILTGNRNDVYQVLSTDITSLNIPIKIGMKHWYIIDGEMREKDENSMWLKILVDREGDGMYEATMTFNKNLITGKEFIEKCGVACKEIKDY